MSKSKHKRNVLACILGVLQACAAFAHDGVPDPGFGAGGAAFLTLDGIEGQELKPTASIALPDGKLLFAGSRNKYTPPSPDPHMRAMVARMNADGSPDSSFGTDPAIPGIAVLPDLQPGTAMQAIEAMQRLADGSIVVTGTAQAFGPPTGFVAKLHADGTMDRDFGSSGDGVVRTGGIYLHALGVDLAGRIVVAGEGDLGGGFMRGVVVRFDADGTIDASFGPTSSGIVFLGEDDPDRYGYVNALVATPDDHILLGGFSEADGPDVGDAYWMIRLDGTGSADASFGGTGSRRFRLTGSDSTFNAIQRLLVLPSGQIVFGAYYLGEADDTRVVLGRLLTNGDNDSSFGDAATPGFKKIDVATDAAHRYLSGLARQDDGKLVATVDYAASSARQNFLAFRTLADGHLDTDFANGGVFEVDLAPNGAYSSSTSLALQGGRQILAGATRRDASSLMVDLAVVRLGPDRIFSGGFELPTVVTTTTNYDDRIEGFIGPAFHHQGVTYREVNEVDGAYPDGVPFVAGEMGNLFIVENATLLFNDFPAYGSAPNALTFGQSYANGDNLTIGPLSSAWLDMDQRSNAVRLDLALYENGPWGGIELRLDAYRNGLVVGTDALVIASDNPGHDNVTTAELAIEDVEFDSLHFYATLGGIFTAPRVMIDDLEIRANSY